MYQLKNVQVQRGANYALHIAVLHIKLGEKIAIMGPSGCGKSTALDLLGLLLRPQVVDQFLFCPVKLASQAGQLVSLDKHSHDLKPLLMQNSANTQDKLAKFRQKHMGYVLQTGGLLPFLNVYENLELQAKALGLEQRYELVQAMAERLQLTDLLLAMPKQLSIGERQRVAIGRALLCKPQVILADEPTSALDPLLADKVMELFLDEVEQAGSTLIMVTHNWDMASRFSLRALHMEVGYEQSLSSVEDLSSADGLGSVRHRTLAKLVS